MAVHEEIDDRRWRELLAEQIRENTRLFFKLAFDVLRDADAAEDACQHAFCRVWEQRDRISDPGALRGYLSRTVLNRCFEVIRRRQTERKVYDDQRHAAARTDGSTAADWVLRESILIALAELPEATRTVVVLRVMRGVSGNETAALMECSASEVSRRLHAGMEQLRPLLSEWRDSVGA